MPISGQRCKLGRQGLDVESRGSKSSEPSCSTFVSSSQNYAGGISSLTRRCTRKIARRRNLESPNRRIRL